MFLTDTEERSTVSVQINIKTGLEFTMDLLTGMTVSRQAVANEALSALPNAPIVADGDTVAASASRRARQKAATVLRRLADVLAPQHAWGSPPAAIR